MQLDDKLLQIISNEVKDNIYDMDVVTPSIYKSVFSKFADLHNANIENEESITDRLLDEKISHYTYIQNKTSENAKKLGESTDKAISGIMNKNEQLLGEVLKETSELKEEIKKLKESVYKDELTHTYNRKWLHDNILDDKGECFKDSGTLAIIDLNYFKLINDTYGHNIGDKVLMFISVQLKKTKEAVVRYGGDEFIVIFCNNTAEKTATDILL